MLILQLHILEILIKSNPLFTKCELCLLLRRW